MGGKPEFKPQTKSEYNCAVKFVHTPKCKDCTPTTDMVKRRSCAGCNKYFYKNR
jgi:hypothetical protein